MGQHRKCESNEEDEDHQRDSYTCRRWQPIAFLLRLGVVAVNVLLWWTDQH